MITSEQAKAIAANPDGCDKDEIKSLHAHIARNPRSAAQELWGEQPGFCRIKAVLALKSYLQNSIHARESRTMGEIPTAITYETNADKSYLQLPAKARW